MTTPNERTVPSPERDEELEKFIDHTIDCTSFDVDVAVARSGVLGYSNDVVDEMMKKVAAFSARRAREKAIEECVSSIIKQADAYDGAWGTTTIGVQLRFVADMLKHKSPTN